MPVLCEKRWSTKLRLEDSNLLLLHFFGGPGELSGNSDARHRAYRGSMFCSAVVAVEVSESIHCNDEDKPETLRPTCNIQVGAYR